MNRVSSGSARRCQCSAGIGQSCQLGFRLMSRMPLTSIEQQRRNYSDSWNSTIAVTESTASLNAANRSAAEGADNTA